MIRAAAAVWLLLWGSLAFGSDTVESYTVEQIRKMAKGFSSLAEESGESNVNDMMAGVEYRGYVAALLDVDKTEYTKTCKQKHSLNEIAYRSTFGVLGADLDRTAKASDVVPISIYTVCLYLENESKK